MYEAVGISKNRQLKDFFQGHGSYGEMQRNRKIFLARGEVWVACMGDMQLLMRTCGSRKIYSQKSPWIMFL